MAQSDNIKGFWPVNAIAREVYHVPIAASQSIKAGDALAVDTLLADLAVAGDARILGFAAEDATSDASSVRTDEQGAKNSKTTIAVHLATPGAIFRGCADADASSVGIGSEVDLVGATGAMLLDVGASSTDVFKLIAKESPDDAVATALSRWLFVVNKPAIDVID